LPEVKSAFKILGVPTVSARFGTAPFFWNWGMQAFANFLPVVRIFPRFMLIQSYFISACLVIVAIINTVVIKFIVANRHYC
jgi:hypothetical protein